MRTLMITALGAALLFGCGDDDGDDDNDVGRQDASTGDSGARDSGTIDGSLDATTSADGSTRADGGVSRASATLESKSDSGVTGTAALRSVDGEVTLEIAISGATPGKHGLHIHVTPDCSAPNASSAGAHWNPSMHTHGDPEDNTHLGDLGNITIAADGRGSLTISKPAWTLGDGASTDVINHAIVFHANEDDLTTQDGDAGPGNSGARQACGVIKAL